METLESTQATEFSETQKMMVFAFMSDVLESKEVLNVAELEDSLQLDFQKLFDSKIAQDVLGGKWHCPIKPWVQVTAKLESNLNAIFISPDGKTMVIGVAGTNFVSGYDWFTEDADVQNMKPWNGTLVDKDSKDTSTSKGYIAEGTSIALWNTWTANRKGQGDSRTFATVVKEYIEGNTDVTEVIVTGHSLGGAITPVLAQALFEFGGLRKGVTIKAYPFADPTSGDQTFINHVGESIQVISNINAHDVVPHAWEKATMKLIDTIFTGQGAFKKMDQGNDSIVANTIAWLQKRSNAAAHPYMRWSRMAPTSNKYGSAEHSFKGLYVRKGHEDEDKKKAVSAMTKIRALIVGLATYGTDPLGKKKNEFLINLIKASGRKVEDKTVAHYLFVMTDEITYFSKFLALLAQQHITAYSWNYFSSADAQAFIAEKSKTLKIKETASETAYTATKGIEVLKTLMSDVAKSTTPST